MASTIAQETQYQVLAADGTVLWTGAAIVAVQYRCWYTDTAALVAEGAVIADGANSAFGSNYVASTSDPVTTVIAINRVASATSVGFVGVSFDPAPVNTATPSTDPKYFVRVNGPGGIMAVNVATTSSGALGSKIGGTGTAGLCGIVTTGNLVTGLVLGVCVKAGAQVGATGYYSAGVLICPS